MKILIVLKHIFVPHHENDFKPHIFREVGVSILLFVSVFLLGSSAGSSFFIHRTVLGASVASNVLIDLTNESRVAYNESPLLRSTKLDQAAQMKGEDMARKEYFSHNSPTGVTPWYWFKAVGYNFLYAGENLAINFTESSDVEKAWLESPTHRANIMNVDFREIGMATVRGMYNDNPTIYIVQMFGTPAYGETVQGKTTSLATAKNVATSSKSTISVGRGNVKGESVVASSTAKVVIIKPVATTTVVVATTTLATTTLATSSPLEKVLLTTDMAIVKNTSVGEKQDHEISKEVSYSQWYERVIFNGSYYIDIIYKILLLIVAIALVTMVFVEIRKQHFIHIMYGIFLLLLLVLFIFINQSFF